MALNDIIFVKGQGGLGRPLEGEDYISGMLNYTADGNLPSGWSTSARIKALFSVPDAENNGILEDYSDATASQATITVSLIGTNGDTVVLTANEPFGKIVDLGTYKKVSGDSTTDLVAIAIAALINENTWQHGYSATEATSVVTVNFPKKLGSYPNTGTPLTVQDNGDIATAVALLNNGYHSRQAIWHYHIAEFFRIQPKGVLYVAFFPYPTTYDFAEIRLVQNYAGGKIRQIAVYAKWRVFNTADITAIHNEIVNNSDVNHKPLSALYAGKMTGISDLSTLTNLNTLTANKCSAVISQDGAGLGAFLAVTSGQSITTIGATLGAVALASVSDDIGWISKFNISNGYECDTIAFANGQMLSDLSQNLLTLLDNYRYIFLLKYVGIAGSYFNDSHTAITVQSDYAYIENNRTIDKAIRGIYSSVLPSLNSPLVLNSDGTLTDNTIAVFTGLAEVNLLQMVRNVELSAFAVTIDPTQNVLSTNNLTIAVKLVPIGVARQITVNIGFTLSI
jgi:hypothetical protein